MTQRTPVKCGLSIRPTLIFRMTQIATLWTTASIMTIDKQCQVVASFVPAEIDHIVISTEIWQILQK